MQNIFDIHDYDDNFLYQFTSQTIPIYDMWSVRPLQNEHKQLIAGTSDDIEKFREFIIEHSEKDAPHPLVIVVGNSEKGQMTNITNSSKKYFKVKFDKFKGNDLGTPLSMNFGMGEVENQNLMQGNTPTYGQRPQLNAMQNQSMSYTEIQGIIDRNVSDASRSIKAEYEESSAKREAESIKRMAELETRMEHYKLDMRAKEVEEKERKLQDELEAFNQEKAEGLGSVKDYTKTIASGLIELGKTAFGIDDFTKKDKSNKKATNKEQTKTEDLKGSNINDLDDDDGFTIKDQEQKQENQQTENNNSFTDLIGVIKNLNEEQKFQLLEILMPDDIDENGAVKQIDEKGEIKEDNINQENTEENEEL